MPDVTQAIRTTDELIAVRIANLCKAVEINTTPANGQRVENSDEVAREQEALAILRSARRILVSFKEQNSARK